MPGVKTKMMLQRSCISVLLPERICCACLPIDRCINCIIWSVFEDSQSLSSGLGMMLVVQVY